MSDDESKAGAYGNYADGEDSEPKAKAKPKAKESNGPVVPTLSGKEFLEMKGVTEQGEYHDGNSLYMTQFLEIMKMKDSPARREAFTNFNQRFEEEAVSNAKIIVDELDLAPAQKTLPPVAIGGVAGGEKFIRNGILYKLTTDPNVGPCHLYGIQTPRVDLAGKAASNELKASNAIFRYLYTTPSGLDVSVPLQLIVDYKGQRVVCMTMLPLKKGRSWMIMGSGDAGASIRNEVVEFDKLASDIADHLYLAAHQVGDKIIYLAGDVEGHINDRGQFFILDMARVYPPESLRMTPHLPPAGTNAIFYRLTRPEFLRKLQVASRKGEEVVKKLSSDSFSRWGMIDAAIHNQAGNTATAYLLGEHLDGVISGWEARMAADVIQFENIRAFFREQFPKLDDDFFKDLEKWAGPILQTVKNPARDFWPAANVFFQTHTGTPLYKDTHELTVFAGQDTNWWGLRQYNVFVGEDLSRLFHSAGLSIRHLAYVWRKVQHPNLKRKLFVSMLQRSIKSYVRSQFLTKGGHPRVVVEVLNSAFGSKARDSGVWTQAVPQLMVSKFGPLAAEDDKTQRQNLFDVVQEDLKEVAQYVCSATGIDIDHYLTNMTASLDLFALTEADVKPMRARVKAASFTKLLEAQHLVDRAFAAQNAAEAFALIEESAKRTTLLLASDPLDVGAQKHLKRCQFFTDCLAEGDKTGKDRISAMRSLIMLMEEGINDDSGTGFSADVELVHKLLGAQQLMYLAALLQHDTLFNWLNSKATKEQVSQALIEACDKNHEVVVRKLFNGRVKPDVEAFGPHQKMTALTFAVCGGKDNLVTILLDAKADPERLTGRNNFNAIQWAVTYQRLSTVKILIERGVGLEKMDEMMDHTPVVAASCYGMTDVVRVLAEAKANIEARESGKMTALVVASWEGRGDAVKALLEFKADITATEQLGRTALGQAAASPHPPARRVPVIKALLEAKAAVDTVDMTGQTPLELAATAGDLESVNLLLEAKANPTYTTPRKNTALIFAAKGGHAAVVQSLLLAKADPAHKNIEEKDAQTVAREANPSSLDKVLAVFDNPSAPVPYVARVEVEAQYSNINSMTLVDVTNRAAIEAAKASAPALGLLLRGGLDPNLRDLSFPNNSLLGIAALNKNYKAVELLITSKADPWCPVNGPNQPVLMLAAIGGSAPVTKLIVQALHNTEPPQAMSITLMLAHRDRIRNSLDYAASVSPAVTQVLAEAKADVTSKNEEGRGALFCAISWVDNPDSVRVLLAHKADPNEVDKGGITPLIEASRSKCVVITQTLVENNADVTYVNPKDGKGPFDVTNTMSIFSSTPLPLSNKIYEVLAKGTTRKFLDDEVFRLIESRALLEPRWKRIVLHLFWIARHYGATKSEPAGGDSTDHSAVFGKLNWFQRLNLETRIQAVCSYPENARHVMSSTILINEGNFDNQFFADQAEQEEFKRVATLARAEMKDHPSKFGDEFPLESFVAKVRQFVESHV